MSKKSMVAESILVVGGKLNETTGHYEMTKKQFEQLDAELGNQGFDYSFCNNKFDDSLKAVYDGKKKNKYAIVKLVVAKKASKKSNKKVQKSKHEEDKKIVKINGLVSGKRTQRTAYVNDYKELTEKAIEEFAKEFGFEYIRSYTTFDSNKMETKAVSKKLA